MIAKAISPRSQAAYNVDELLSLLGWPLGDQSYPGIERIGAQRLPVPAALTRHERIIGDGTHPATLRPVGIATSDAVLHTHVLAPTGTGKSTLLANLVLQDIAAGRGALVVDPKGELVTDVLARIPEHRRNDVVVLDVADELAPVGLNPLAGTNGDLAVDGLIAVFRGLYGDALGPRSGDILHASLLTLIRSKTPTLLALPLLLTDERFRQRLMQHVKGDIVLDPFWRWFGALSVAERSHVVAPLMNKVRPWLVRPSMRRVIGQMSPRFNMSSVFSENKIVLVPLDAERLGSEGAALFGSIVVSMAWRAAQSQLRIDPEKRRLVPFVLDEFQKFLHLPADITDVLATARSLGVGLVLAHQHLGQLSPVVRSAVAANGRNRVYFRLPADDAAVVARTTRILNADDFQALGRFEAYASLMTNGEATDFCSIATRSLVKAFVEPDDIRNLSRERYGTSVDDIDAEIAQLYSQPSLDASNIDAKSDVRHEVVSVRSSARPPGRVTERKRDCLRTEPSRGITTTD